MNIVGEGLPTNIGNQIRTRQKIYGSINRTTEEILYLNILDKILNTGDYRNTRNAKTYSIFGEKLEFDLENGFPLLTTKQIFYRGIIEELLFFLKGQTNTIVFEPIEEPQTG